MLGGSESFLSFRRRMLAAEFSNIRTERHMISTFLPLAFDSQLHSAVSGVLSEQSFIECKSWGAKLHCSLENVVPDHRLGFWLHIYETSADVASICFNIMSYPLIRRQP